MALTQAEVRDSGLLWTLWEDKEELLFPVVWLRDNCQCSCCWDTSSKSRLLRMDQLNIDTVPSHVKVVDNTLGITWDDGHESNFLVEWLLQRQFTEKAMSNRLAINFINPKCWGSEMQRNIPTIDFNQLMTDDAIFYKWLVGMEEEGIYLITGASTEDAIKCIGKRVAYLKTTNYGTEFTVKSKPDPSNVAYTTAGLGLHTDMPYYHYVPGMQMLHCIAQHGTIGGENMFSDGFHVAAQVRKEQPEHFAALTELPVDFWDFGKEDFEFHLRTRKPTIRLNKAGEVEQINYNNHVRDSQLNMPLNKVIPYYSALKAFENQLMDDKNAITIKLKKGEIVCFHNYRVLHARKEYRLEEGGDRHLNGGYIDWDELHSARRVLQESN